MSMNIGEAAKASGTGATPSMDRNGRRTRGAPRSVDAIAG